VLEQDENSCPTGNVIPIANTRFSFEGKENIAEVLEHNNGYDLTYVLLENQGALSFAASCSVPDSNFALEVWTTAPCVHFYSGPFIPPLTGKGGANYGKNSGLCFETQIHPDAINFAHFPSIILEPQDTFVHRTEYRIVNK
jgi:aldose 1-epimerase